MKLYIPAVIVGLILLGVGGSCFGAEEAGDDHKNEVYP